MAENTDPEWTSTDPEVDRDPDLAHEEGETPNVLPGADDPELGETKRIEEEKHIYEAGTPDPEHSEDGHAVGGSEGTADGQ
ncbi:hypothetical protein [Gordonia soli]|uniref:Uncharacterized protein n=1 Tax=Gordonia soli NBRC 108243 TaxID=1223545 RepID=M0QGY9_9ACTN|nr:hypothetical protein [Gordonia soli]GAC66692.1 hypothetical protein GS4_03_01400 [Gordonia soli NBRC 108243]